MEYMSLEQKYSYSSTSLDRSLELGNKLAGLIKPPLLIEMVGDLGGGKTALVKSIAKGLGIEQTVTSPTFNIHRGYESPNGIRLEHFDLYRLNDDEIVANELKDCLEDPKTIVCTEWANHFSGHLAEDRLVVECHYISENERRYDFKSTGPKSSKIIERLKK
jgi:tRNA threonylcarbamoyladenosine biosynthesis protein TsaE